MVYYDSTTWYAQTACGTCHGQGPMVRDDTKDAASMRFTIRVLLK
ncbi:MAG: hypothetical protein SOZ09_04325 [Eubacteriales bacterium]|nr:hypothetical protein [Eubacteriales bacterium]MDY3941196.1 hypothetical protein [Eubacteriales bacterium]